MKAASTVLQDSSLFVTMTFQIEEQKKKNKKKKRTTAAILSEKTNKSQSFPLPVVSKNKFLGGGFARGREFSGFDSVHSSFQNVSCQLRGIPISPRTS